MTPHGDLKCLQSNRLDWHSVFESFHEARKTTFLYHFCLPLRDLRTIRNEISFDVCVGLLTACSCGKRSRMMNLEENIEDESSASQGLRMFTMTMKVPR